jgi:two-component system, HptB-dependent secretion and biofilm response regulator
MNRSLLIVDDEPNIIKSLKRQLRHEGYDIYSAQSGQAGLDLLKKHNSAVVLSDQMMPEMDGIAFLESVKKFQPDTVRILLTAYGTLENAIAAVNRSKIFEYLTKPWSDADIKHTISRAFEHYDLVVENRRLHKMTREQNKQLNEQNEALRILMDEKDREMAFAEKIYSKIVYKGSMEENNVNFWTSPLAIFSGDMLLMARSPSGELNGIMGDFTGHGLSAAMGAIPASEVFYAMTAKGYSLNEIAMELNRKLKELLPANMFLAAGLVRMDSAKSTATVWTGAVPDLFILGKEGGVKKRLMSRNFPLGVVDNDMLGSTVEVISLAKGDRLCLFSDGVTEAERADGEMFGEERLEECLNRNRGDHLLEEVRTAVDKFRGGESQSDDVTMVEIICDGNASRPSGATIPKFPEGAT